MIIFSKSISLRQISTLLVAIGTGTRLLAQPAVYTYDPSGDPIAAIPGGASPPAILAQPSSQLLESNAPVTFSISASGAGLSYQWFSNGVAITGATSDSLVLPNLTGTNFAAYSVRVSNTSGSVTSAPAAIWPDTNGNGLPDWWEMQYFGNLNQTASGDFDGDGVSNFDEYVEGTNPADPTSFNPRLGLVAAHGSVAASPEQPYYTLGQFVHLTATPDPGQTFIGWSGALQGNKPDITLVMDTNKFVLATFGLPLEIALDNSNLVWTTGGDALWFGQAEVSHDGLGSAQSGPIVSYWNGSTFVGSQTWLQTAFYLSQTMQLGFWWNVSSRPPAGLSFTIDGTNCAFISGEMVGWQQIQTNLLAGNHFLTWTYSKGPVDIPTGIPFSDSGWVDTVTLASTNAAPPPPVLNIALTATNTGLVWWPAAPSGFVLEENSNLAGGLWSNVTNPVNVVAAQNQVLIAPTAASRFYRLRYP